MVQKVSNNAPDPKNITPVFLVNPEDGTTYSGNPTMAAISFVAASSAAASSVIIIPGTAGMRVRVLNVSTNVAGSCVIQFTEGFATSLTGTMSYLPGPGFVAQGAPWAPVFITSTDSNGVQLSTQQGVVVAGAITWIVSNIP